ncbi:hypothetical protein [Azospirillum canadense]|uniref:hypothetical protein n=1 Tax=Azospirillum canadense TaxID=403962 RepID=UPI00222626B1|nr:hypothetical protein [Azospirillum canadense]MCW2243218.1 hypothetical protein [Azospirillum canadense]
MSKHDQNEDPHDDDRSRNAANIGVAVVVVILLVVGYWLINALIRQSKLEDCMLAHRRDCIAVEAPRT